MNLNGLKLVGLAGLSAFLIACGGADKAAGSTAAEPQADAVEQPAQSSGLVSKQLQAGDGATAEAGKRVTVHYTGWLYDENAENNEGKKFDSSVDRSQPFTFPLGQGRVIRGWDEGVAGMQVGEKRRLIIPPHLGYGARGAGNLIPGGATLVFDVELLGVN